MLRRDAIALLLAAAPAPRRAVILLDVRTRRVLTARNSGLLAPPGSTLKPFIYGLAFEDGFVHPESLIDDRPIRFGSYAPENFDMTFQGTVPVRKALQLSLNVPAIKGGFINGLVKRGGNTVEGSLNGYYSDSKWQAKLNVDHPLLTDHTIAPTKNWDMAINVGGPIIKDNLFYMIAVERNIGSTGQIFDSRAIAVYPSLASTSNTINKMNLYAKLDWNINDSQKFELTFRHTAGEAPNFYNYTSSFETSLSSSWYNTYRTDQSYTAKLNSDWSAFIPNFRTEIEGTYKRYNGTARLNGAD